jgi:2-polyprenyl-3-methyl-5-hydroxy-6-metoxy-1,4-benzoquinol methylase
MHSVPYEHQTVDRRNPIARFTHQTRMRKSKRLVTRHLTASATVLDYGCGQGRFLHELAIDIRNRQPEAQVSLLGYDPFTTTKFEGYRVVSDVNEFDAESVDVLTSLEVCEHLTDAELQEFINLAVKVLTPKGRLLVSVPIEIGPAVLVKEISRCILHHRHLEMPVPELLKAAIFGIPAQRAKDRKSSHRGFDWRNIRRILAETFPCEHIEFSPLPMPTWYGQSQVFMVFRKS